MAQAPEITLMTKAVFDAKAAYQDGILLDYRRRVQSLEVLGGLAPGNVSDATMAGVAANRESSFSAALADRITEAKKVKGKGGVTFLRFDPAGDPTQHVLELSPAKDLERVKIEFWSAPEGVAGRMRTMSIESHGTADPYNPTNNHNSIYTTDAAGAFQHVVDWDWGPTYDGLVHFPTMKITAHQNASFDKHIGVGTRTPQSSGGDALDRTIHMETTQNRPAELRQVIRAADGTLSVEARMKTYSTKAFLGTYTAHDLVLIAGGEANANMTLRPDGRVGFFKDVGIGTNSPVPATAGRRVFQITDATGSELRVGSGTVSLRMAAVAAGSAQFGADSQHDMTFYAGGVGNGQVRMSATGGLAFFNGTPRAKPTGVTEDPASIFAALLALNLIGR